MWDMGTIISILPRRPQSHDANAEIKHTFISLINLLVTIPQK